MPEVCDSDGIPIQRVRDNIPALQSNIEVMKIQNQYPRTKIGSCWNLGFRKRPDNNKCRVITVPGSLSLFYILLPHRDSFLLLGKHYRNTPSPQSSTPLVLMIDPKSSLPIALHSSIYICSHSLPSSHSFHTVDTHWDCDTSLLSSAATIAYN